MRSEHRTTNGLCRAVAAVGVAMALLLALPPAPARAQAADLSPVRVDLVRPLVQTGRWIWMGDSYTVTARERIPYATLAVWPLDAVSGIVLQNRIGAARLLQAPRGVPFRWVQADSGYRVQPGGAVDDPVGLPLYFMAEWTLAGEEAPLATLSVRDSFEDGWHGPLGPEVSLRPLVYLPRDRAYRGSVQIGDAVRSLPDTAQAPAGTFAALADIDARMPADALLRAAPGAEGGLVYAGTVLRPRPAPATGHYAQFVADGSWSFRGFGADADPSPDWAKQFRTADLASYLAATTLDPAQPPVFAYYLASEPFRESDADNDAVVDRLLAVAREAAARAGLPAPVFLLVHAHAIANGSIVGPEANERTGVVLRRAALRHADVAFVSLYQASDGVVFDGSPAALDWVQQRGVGVFRFGQRNGTSLLPLDLADGAFVPDGLHPDIRGAAFFAGLLWTALTGEAVPVREPPTSPPPPTAPSGVYPNPARRGVGVVGLPPSALVTDARGRQVARTDAAGTLPAAQTARLPAGVYHVAGGHRVVVIG